MPNTELLRRTLRQCETDPDTWTQQTFVTYCGTGHCFGGWAITLSGIHINPERAAVAIDQLPAAIRERLDPMDMHSGYVYRLPTVAAILLDIPRWAPFGGERHLFDAHNTLDDLRAMVDELCAQSVELVLERKDQPDRTPVVGPVMLTPAIDEAYWSYRVVLSSSQAIVGFPKFGTVGIGFALEDDWNTNLPYTCSAQTIFEHIAHNKADDSIADEDCVRAIEMIRTAVYATEEHAARMAAEGRPLDWTQS